MPPTPARPCWVHPRVCGEASPSAVGTGTLLGPSPRVRGSRNRDRGAAVVPGSIPACAGKPASRRHRETCTWVHPRVCGEASRGGVVLKADKGPSPRVRGSLGRLEHGAGQDGSIPACAGKPCESPVSAGVGRVHPRVCGEADWRIYLDVVLAGPSPRVRGSLQVWRPFNSATGSIPACAGKPRRWCRACWCRWVHPRVCGEAGAWSIQKGRGVGPSPRVRGSRRVMGRGRTHDGSIPACAGKPRTRPPPR